MQINLQRILERLDAIYACGAQVDGTHSRLAFSDGDVKGRALYMSWFRTMGFSPRVDAAGNIRVRLPGKEDSLPCILIGSHLDTVPDGGKYDGVLGCIGALEVFETLHQARHVTNHPLEAIVFADEEGARFGKGLFGSSAVCGACRPPSPEETDAQGANRAEVLADFGIQLNALETAAIAPESVHCFLELHIEQGAALWKSGIAAGVVTSIAGVDRFSLTFTGQANHAGSTLMADRRDALVAAAAFAAAVPETVRTFGGDFSMATVGQLQVAPGAINVVPGQCRLTLEIRDREQTVMHVLQEKLLRCAQDAASGQGVDLVWEVISLCPPAPMSDWVTEGLEQTCQASAPSYRLMPSGAYHDSLLMTGRFPTGMLFIPSQGGISHSPLEYSAPEAIQTGCQLLLDTVLTLDKKTT